VYSRFSKGQSEIAIRNPGLLESAIRNPQPWVAGIRNPQSAIRNPQSKVAFFFGPTPVKIRSHVRHGTVGRLQPGATDGPGRVQAEIQSFREVTRPICTRDIPFRQDPDSAETLHEQSHARQ
jgi:hypothetical protein